jgi:hypothetical protein
MQSPREFRLNFVGDVMLGRLIDQLMPSHVYEPTEARHLTVSKASYLLLHFFRQELEWHIPDLELNLAV